MKYEVGNCNDPLAPASPIELDKFCVAIMSKPEVVTVLLEAKVRVFPNRLIVEPADEATFSFTAKVPP